MSLDNTASPDDYIQFAPEISDDDLCSDSDSAQASDFSNPQLSVETQLKLANLRAYIYLGLP